MFANAGGSATPSLSREASESHLDLDDCSGHVLPVSPRLHTSSWGPKRVSGRSSWWRGSRAQGAVPVVPLQREGQQDHSLEPVVSACAEAHLEEPGLKSSLLPRPGSCLRS